MYEQLIMQLRRILPGYTMSVRQLKDGEKIVIKIPGRSSEEANATLSVVIRELRGQFTESGGVNSGMSKLDNMPLIFIRTQKIALTDEEEKSLKAALEDALLRVSRSSSSMTAESAVSAAGLATATETQEKKKEAVQPVQTVVDKVSAVAKTQEEPLLSFQSGVVVKRKASNLYEGAVLKVLEMLNPYVGNVCAIAPIDDTTKIKCLFMSTCVVIYDRSFSVDSSIKITFAEYDANRCIIRVIDTTLARHGVVNGVETAAAGCSLIIYPLQENGFSQIMAEDKWQSFLREFNETHTAGCIAADQTHGAIVGSATIRKQILQAEESGRSNTSLVVSSSQRPGVVVTINVMSGFFGDGRSRAQSEPMLLPNGEHQQLTLTQHQQPGASVGTSATQQQLVAKTPTAPAKCCIQ